MTLNRYRQYNRSEKSAPDGGSRAASERLAKVQRHKYAVGQRVHYILGSTGRLSREVEKSISGSAFEISRQLPSAGAEFQYRVKNMTTGQERVVNEGDIASAEQHD